MTQSDTAGHPVPRGARDLRDISILLVEDDLGDRRLFTSQLERGGLHPDVRAAGSLADGIAALGDGTHVDLVLLDLGLPDSQGLATLDAVVATTHDVPIVVLTGQGDAPDIALDALRRGAHDYLVKGETGTSELRRAIRYAIERHDMQRRASSQLLHQAALHQLETASTATADLQSFAQAAASAVQVGLDARMVSVHLDGPSLPSVTAATAARERLTPDTPLEHEPGETVIDLTGEDGIIGRITVTPSSPAGLTTDQRRFLATVTGAITTRIERLVANLALSTRTRQLDTVQRVAEQLQRQRDPQAAVDTVAGMLLEGLDADEAQMGVHVEVDDLVADAGASDVSGGVVVAAPVSVRGDVVGTVALLRDADHAPGVEERGVLDGVAAQLGTWWALVQADREHRRDIDRIAQLMETAPVGLALVDGDGVVRFANAAALELVRAEDVASFPWRFDEASQADMDPALAAVAHVRAVGAAARDVRVALQQPDGSERVLAVNASPLAPGPDGGRGMAMALNDVTAERRRAVLLETALDREQRSAEELRRVGELKDGFLRALSHELRTPLASIVGFVETLQDHGDDLDPTETKRMLGRLQSNAQRLGMLLEDLLDVGRLTAGVSSPPNRSEHSLDLLVRDVVKLLPTDDHEIELDLEETRTLVDVPKVERIVHNLVGNAIRHTPEGTTIRIMTRRQADHALLVVDDSGPGIPHHQHGEIFEPFVQGPRAAAEASPGTGVGLSLVRQFVELHGGSVTLDDGPLGGARFRVELPDTP